MRATFATFDLLAWRRRLQWTQTRAAHELGLSHAAYRAAEYHASDTRGKPVRLAYIRLAQLIEAHPPRQYWQPPPIVRGVNPKRRKAA